MPAKGSIENASSRMFLLENAHMRTGCALVHAGHLQIFFTPPNKDCSVPPNDVWIHRTPIFMRFFLLPVESYRPEGTGKWAVHELARFSLHNNQPSVGVNFRYSISAARFPNSQTVPRSVRLKSSRTLTSVMLLFKEVCCFYANACSALSRTDLAINVVNLWMFISIQITHFCLFTQAHAFLRIYLPGRHPTCTRSLFFETFVCWRLYASTIKNQVPPVSLNGSQIISTYSRS